MIRSRLRTILAAATIVAVLAAAASIVAVVYEPIDRSSGTSAPALAGADLNGERRDLAELRGQVVLVNFWASWCPPCEDEIPVLVRAQERYAGRDLAILGVNSQDRLGSARRAAEQWGADAYPNLRDDDGTVAVDWGVVGLPETFVIAPDGTILERHKGPVTTRWMDQVVEPLLERS